MILGRLTPRLVLLLFLYLAGLALLATQTTDPRGAPYIRNYSPMEYGAHAGNWSIVQDMSGITYFANNDCILEFDGRHWAQIKIPNRFVRSLAIGPTETVYVGGSSEFGYLTLNALGQHIYVSLLPKLGRTDLNFLDIMKIVTTSHGIYFLSPKFIFRLIDERIEIIPLKMFDRYGFNIRDDLFVIQSEKGIAHVRAGQMQLLPHTRRFTISETGNMLILPYLERQLLLIDIVDQGKCYIYDLNPFYDAASGGYDFSRANTVETIITPLLSEVSSYISANGNLLYDGILLPNDRYALATMNGGIVIIDDRGRLQQVINKKRGLLSNYVTSLLLDREHNLWAAMNPGIAYIAIQSPITRFDGDAAIEGTPMSVGRFKEQLFVGTNIGAFALDEYRLQMKNDQLHFTSIAPESPEVYGFFPMDDHLWGTGYPRLQLVDRQMQIRSFGNNTFFSVVRSHKVQDTLIVGCALGLNTMELHPDQQGQLHPVLRTDVFKGITETIRQIVVDKAGDLWVSTFKQGLIHVHFNSRTLDDCVITRYGEADGLPRPGSFFAFIIDDRILVATPQGIYEGTAHAESPQNNPRISFQPEMTFGRFFNDPPAQVQWLQKDQQNRWWVNANQRICRITSDTQGRLRIDRIPFAPLPPNDYPPTLDEQGVLWVPTAQGVYRYDERIHKEYKTPFPAQIRQVTTGMGRVLFADQKQPTNQLPALEYKENTLTFSFSAPYFEHGEAINFTYFLQGFDVNWSEWLPANTKEYTNLPEGTYTFRVKARNIYEQESSESIFCFFIAPPWSRTLLAYLLFTLTGLFVLVAIVKLYTFRLHREKERLEKTVQERTIELCHANSMLEGQALDLEFSNQRLEENTQELAHSNQMLERINTIVKMINAEFDLNTLLKSILNEVMVLDGVEKATILAYDNVVNAYKFVASIGWDMKDLEPICLTLTEAENRYCQDAQEIFDGIFIVKEFANRGNQEMFKKIAIPKGMLVIRIKIENMIWGYLIFDNLSNENAFFGPEVEILHKLKDHITSAFVKNRLLVDLQHEQQTAELANQAKSMFLARMSHEIRTPMNGVLGFAEMMFDTELSQEQQEYMHTIFRSGEALLTLINDILDITKIEAGMFTIEAIDFDPEVTSFDVCELIQPRLGSKEVELICHIGDSVPHYVSADPGRFRQVLMNLMGNAVKFTAAGEIKLSIDVAQERESDLLLHCQIKDSGIGIPPDKLQTIFEVFQQADETTTRKFGGTGLGLSISRQIARLMKGDVWVESELGKGSVFHFTALVGKSAKKAEKMLLEENLEHRRILVVDDNPENIEILTHVLNKLGLRVASLPSGNEVLSVLSVAYDASDPFALCILDIQMPVINGYMVAQGIRHSGQTFANMPLLAYSSSTSRQTGLIEKAGFDGFLPKPFRRDRLVKMLKSLLGKSKQDEQKNKPSDMITRHTLIEKAKHSLSILIAEDNVINQKLVQYTLSRAGYQLEIVANGRQAIEMVQANPQKFQLIFMDVQMPDMNGLEATRQLRAMGFTDIPIIAMTAGAFEGDRQKCLDAGMNDYISKPLKREEVFCMLKKWTFDAL